MRDVREDDAAATVDFLPSWKPCGGGFRSRLRVVRQRLSAAVSSSATRSRSSIVVAPPSGMVLILFSGRSRPLSKHRPTCRRALSLNCCPAGCKPSATGRLVTGSVVSRTMSRKAVPSLAAPVYGGLEFHRGEGRGMGRKKVDVRQGIGDLFDSGQGILNRLLLCPVPGGSAQKRSNHRSRNCPCRMRQVEDRLRGNNARPVPALDRQGIAPPSLVDPLALDGRRRHGA